MTSTPSPWTHATKHCWSHVETATRMAQIVEKLSTIDVPAAQPIVSTIGPSILIAVHHPKSADHLRELCTQIKAALGGTDLWKSFPSGDYHYLRYTHDGVMIDISTEIPVSKPQAFEVGV